MWSTGSVPWARATGGLGTLPASTGLTGPAMMTLRSVIAQLATTIRCAGIVYVGVQVAIWHSFYAGSPWRLAVPALAVGWAAAVTAYLRRNWPSPILTGVDSVVYLALALGAQGCVPPDVRDGAFSWLVIVMSGQLIVSAWYAPSALSVPLVLSSPLAYVAGAELWPVTSTRMMAGGAVLLFAVGLVHLWGRRVLYGRAARADADVGRADKAAREQYAILSRNIERREHERLLHDTILNTLTAVARGSARGSTTAVSEVVTRCRRDVALMEAALGGTGDVAVDAVRPPDDLLNEVRGVVADMRARGLTVHLHADEAEGTAVPARVITALSNAVREALSNVAAHAGTGEAWVSVRHLAPDAAAADPCRLRITVRDQGAGFDPARVDQSRLGLSRSIAERTAECGGQASVWSEPGQGTEVSLSWPAREDPAW
jgi:signal transduction histidine kinase